jgi:hypothetical protein
MCHEDVTQEGLRYTADIMIVPVSQDSFRKAMSQNIYVIPSRYKGRRRPKFIAFYRGGSIGAITHIARVIKVISRVPQEKISSLLESELHTLPIFATCDNEFELFSISRVFQLRHRIVRGEASPIQNRVFKSFPQFAKAKKLEDLYEKSRSQR